jgi:hypothetical protein
MTFQDNNNFDGINWLELWIYYSMFNLDEEFHQLLEDIFTQNTEDNEKRVKNFCADILCDLY